ncbi:hypothetical protein AVEN_62919-1, partial [Araneus ventricosus]
SIVACLGFTGVLFAGCDAMLNTVAFILGGLCGDFAIFGVALVPTDIAPSVSGIGLAYAMAYICADELLRLEQFTAVQELDYVFKIAVVSLAKVFVIA